VAGLWHGTAASCLSAPGAALQFCIYERLKLPAEPGGVAPAAQVGAASAVSSIATTLVFYPLEVLRSRTQAALRGETPPMARLARDMWRNEGAGAFYKVRGVWRAGRGRGGALAARKSGHWGRFGVGEGAGGDRGDATAGGGGGRGGAMATTWAAEVGLRCLTRVPVTGDPPRVPALWGLLQFVWFVCTYSNPLLARLVPAVAFFWCCRGCHACWLPVVCLTTAPPSPPSACTVSQGITASLVRTVPNGAMALCSYEFFVRLLTQLLDERGAR